MRLSDSIEQFIKDLLSQEPAEAENAGREAMSAVNELTRSVMRSSPLVPTNKKATVKVAFLLVEI